MEEKWTWGGEGTYYYKTDHSTSNTPSEGGIVMGCLFFFCEDLHDVCLFKVVVSEPIVGEFGVLLRSGLADRCPRAKFSPGYGDGVFERACCFN
jgi:hypothetical protein